MTRYLVIERSILHQFGREQSRLVETCYVIGELLSVSGTYNSSIDGMVHMSILDKAPPDSAWLPAQPAHLKYAFPLVCSNEWSASCNLVGSVAAGGPRRKRAPPGFKHLILWIVSSFLRGRPTSVHACPYLRGLIIEQLAHLFTHADLENDTKIIIRLTIHARRRNSPGS